MSRLAASAWSAGDVATVAAAGVAIAGLAAKTPWLRDRQPSAASLRQLAAPRRADLYVGPAARVDPLGAAKTYFFVLWV
jgi:hypothetical protein